MSEYCFTSLCAQSWQYRDRRKPEAGTMPYFFFERLQGFFIVHSTMGSTLHSRPLNSLGHCIYTTTITNIRPDRDSNLVYTSRLQAPVDTNEPSGPATIPRVYSRLYPGKIHNIPLNNVKQPVNTTGKYNLL